MRAGVMNWEEAIKFHGVPEDFHKADIENSKMIPEKIYELGKAWIKNPITSLFLTGNPGGGKTYFSYSLFRGLIEREFNWLIFKRSVDLDNELLQKIFTNQHHHAILKYSEVPFLFIDDLGTERTTERVQTDYFDIIDNRMNANLITIITTNLDKSCLEKRYGDRIFSRVDPYFEVKFPKKDLRKEQKIVNFNGKCLKIE